jgi:hypothetical protein
MLEHSALSECAPRSHNLFSELKRNITPPPRTPKPRNTEIILIFICISNSLTAILYMIGVFNKPNRKHASSPSHTQQTPQWKQWNSEGLLWIQNLHFSQNNIFSFTYLMLRLQYFFWVMYYTKTRIINLINIRIPLWAGVDFLRPYFPDPNLGGMKWKTDGFIPRGASLYIQITKMQKWTTHLSRKWGPDLRWPCDRRGLTFFLKK